MAVSTSSYFSNSVIGAPQVGADIDIYETTTTPKYPIGFGFTRADGNKYRYCHFGTLVVTGNVVATDVSESGYEHTDSALTTVAKLKRRGGETLDPNYIGARYMQLTITATTDQFAGGYIAITSGLGYGFGYRIKGNTATSDGIPTTGDIYMDLYDPIQVSIDSRACIAIAGCKYANLEAASSTDCVPAGIAVTGVTASSYGWVCTHGIIPVLQDATIPTSGKRVAQLSTATAGCVTSLTHSVTCFPIIGTYIVNGTSTTYSIVDVTIE